MSTREERLEAAAQLCERAAAELDKAAAHARRAAEHFRNGEISRAAAHEWAAHGHVLAAQQALDEQALEHRTRSQV